MMSYIKISADQLDSFFVQTKSSKRSFEEDFVKKTLKLDGSNPLKTQEWWVEPLYSASKFKSDDEASKREWRGGFDPQTGEILTSFGQVGGKIQTTRRKIEENKSGRSLLEQAFMDLKQKYKLKMSKDGFVTAATATATATAATFSEVGKKDKANAEKTTNETTLVAAAANCFDSERPFPMLAKTFEFDENKVKKQIKRFPVFTQPKADGVRVLIDLDEKGEIRFSSRARNDFTYLKQIFESEVKKIFEKISMFSGATEKDLVLDGELSMKNKDGSDDFQSTISAVKKVKGGLKEDAKEKLSILLFTFFSKAEKPEMSFQKRNEVIEEAATASAKALEKMSCCSKVSFMKTKEATSLEELKKLHDEYVSSGSEGLMIYIPEGKYEPNKRSSNLLKYKEFNDAEGKIVGVRPGKGRESNAAMVDIQVSRDVVVTMHPKGTIKEREEWLLDPSRVIGKLMTYTYQGLTDKGIPRFPVAVAIRDYE